MPSYTHYMWLHVYIFVCACLCTPQPFLLTSPHSVRVIILKRGKIYTERGVCVHEERCECMKAENVCVNSGAICLCQRHPDTRLPIFLLNTKIKHESFALNIYTSYTYPYATTQNAHTLTELHLHKHTHIYACTVTHSLSTWYTCAKLI